MKSFTDLHAWKSGLELVEEIYKVTKLFPKEEVYGMTSQLKRCSTSILANLAEGFGRFTYPDKTHKYIIARGECTETEAFLHIAARLDFTSEEQIRKALELTQQTGRLISGLIRSSKEKFPA